eukprot:Skav208191  [mRNA]  locus=scaffold2530:516451:517857:- [translate_table: standard]
MFPHSDVVPQYRALARGLQALALGLLAILGVMIVRQLGQPEYEFKLVPPGNLPYLCLCCMGGDRAIGGGANAKVKAPVPVPVHFEQNPDSPDRESCVCADYSESSREHGDSMGSMGVACSYQIEAGFRFKDASGKIKKPSGHTNVVRGWSHYFLKKKQSGADYAFSQSCEDEFEGSLGFFNEHKYNGPDHFPKWKWEEQVSQGHTIVAWLYLPDEPIWRQMSLGFLKKAVKALGELGGLFTTFSGILCFFFIRKNKEHEVAKVYEERTFRFARTEPMSQKEENYGTSSGAYRRPSKLPPPPKAPRGSVKPLLP